MLFFNLLFLKSRKRYWSLKSSLISWSVLISKGNIFVLLPNTSISSIRISTKPVFSFGLTVSSSLFLTSPKTVTEDSIGIWDAKSTSSGLPEVTTCVIPYISRISKNTRPPRSRIVSTKPAILTFFPTSSKLISLQVCVLYLFIFNLLLLDIFNCVIYKISTKKRPMHYMQGRNKLSAVPPSLKI